MRAASPWVDFGTAWLAAFGTLAALMARQDRARPEGRGRAAAHRGAFNNPDARRAAVTGRPHRDSQSRPTSAPSDLFRTKDGWIIATASAIRCSGAGPADRRGRTRSRSAFGRPGARRPRRDHLEAHREWTAERTTAEALADSKRRASPRGRSIRRSRRSRTRIFAPPACWDSEYPGLARPVPLAPTPVDYPRRPGASAIARPRSASTPTRSSASWATTAPPSPASAHAA